jgi:type I restriction-modification system DNA methylase subunit
VPSRGDSAIELSLELPNLFSDPTNLLFKLCNPHAICSHHAMAAPPEILELIARFEQQIDSYKSGEYNETQLRREFLDPFFKALGWDIDNTQGYAEAYKDVVHEDAIRIGDSHKAPDYCFRIGGTRKFFLEAKKPSVSIKDEVMPAYQLRSYGWSAKLPLSILSDFEEMAVYDCRVKPFKDDTAATARVFYCTYQEYAEKWDEIASIFSRQAILKGSFDRFAESSKAKKGTAEFDEDFLATIEEWRKELAQNLALRNPKLTQRELNFAVQRIIDRIIFLRICEARGIEDYGRLLSLVNGDRIYPRLTKLFEEADARYNSGLFHFKKESGRHEAPDELTLALDIDDKLLRNILRHLYYPESPYRFSVISADILGQVYEQFLGKIIRLTEGHQAKVEDKPEVKKAGGVYYTPTYIVDYIVQQTVGKLVEDKTPKQIGKIRILDPACGSGSFLIGAYQFLLDWHLHYYTANQPEKWARGGKPALVQTSKGWKLTIAERKRILLNNIYGVDIDMQAVEVTKLSLLLKVLEGETGQTLQTVLRIFQERALPDLGDNIKCGNSLIGPEFYNQAELPLLTDEERYRINVFDWQAEFPEIFQAGGFDAVIGNPPYIRIQTMKDSQPQEVEFFSRVYESASEGNYDIYVVFIERALSLLNKKGTLGFIVPHKFFNAEYGRPARFLLSNHRSLKHIVHFGAQQVFSNATTYTCLLFATQIPNATCNFVNAPDLKAWIKAGISVSGEIAAATITDLPWNFAVGDGADLVNRLKGMPVKLGDIADIFVGLQTSADDVFILDAVTEAARTIRLKSKILAEEVTLEKELLHALVSGTDVQGYAPLPSRQYLLFPYTVSNETANLISSQELALRFPKISDYLNINKKRLQDRERGKFRDGHWYRFGRSQNLGIQSRIKICVPRLVDRLCAGFDADGSHFLDNVDVGGVTLIPGQKYDLRYLLGLLNSKLLAWFFPNVSAPFRGGWMSANRQFLSQVPVRVINFTDKSEKAAHDRMVSLVEQMLDFHKQLAAARTPQEKTALERQMTATDSQIDRLVYDLYGLTEDEIKIVEGKTEMPAAPEIEEAVEAAPRAGRRAKSPFARAPKKPAPEITPEKAYADAAHFYGKEEAPPYRTSNGEKKP